MPDLVDNELNLKVGREKALLALVLKQGEDPTLQVEELGALADSAGADIVDVLVQHRDKPSVRGYFGKGKVEEVKDAAKAYLVDLVIVGGQLSPSQLAFLEDALDCKVIDRNQLILDLFAQRAKSGEGRLQVSLAQLKYSLPRLKGLGEMLSRLGGGIGTRGPGETKLEVGRRQVRDQINRLEQKLAELEATRANKRQQRLESGLFLISLVGYTNSGKSTLFNALTGSDLYADDRLFATLDPTTRILKLASGRTVLITDTVGFLRDLPHQLVAAFHSTLEETLHADLLLHVVDISNPDFPSQQSAVSKTLKELGAGELPIVTLFNKLDALEGDERRELVATLPGDGLATLFISAKTGEGLDRLLALLDREASASHRLWQLTVPYARLGLLEQAREQMEILSEEYGQEGGVFIVKASQSLIAALPREVERVEVEPGAEGGT